MSHVIDETPFCPTCGKPNTVRQSPEWLLVHFKGILGGVLALLIECRRQRRTASFKELCDAAYPDRKVLPETAHLSVRSMLQKDRGRLQQLGWEIVGPRTTGNGWCLVPLETDRH